MNIYKLHVSFTEWDALWLTIMMKNLTYIVNNLEASSAYIGLRKRKYS